MRKMAGALAALTMFGAVALTSSAQASSGADPAPECNARTTPVPDGPLTLVKNTVVSGYDGRLHDLLVNAPAVHQQVNVDVLLPPSYAPVAIAAINTIGMIGSFVAPILWGWAKDLSGSYDLGLRLLPVGFALAGLIVLLLRRAVRPRTSSTLALGPVAEEV